MSPYLASSTQGHEAIQYIQKPCNSQIKAAIEALFNGACANSGSKKLRLPSNKFRMFLLDFGLIDLSWNTREIDTIYTKSTKGYNKLMDFEGFVIALSEVSYRRNRMREEAFGTLLEEILSREAVLPLYYNATPTVSFSDEYAFERLFWIYENCFRRIFDEYSTVFICPKVSDNPKREKVNVVTLQSFIRFARHFQFYPSFLSSTDVNRFFKHFENNKIKADSEVPFLTFNEFTDCILRMGVFIYSKPQFIQNYNSPEERAQVFFESWSEPYLSTFAVSMEKEKVDLDTIGPPIMRTVNPDHVTHSGGKIVTIEGKNFDHRLGGVWVQFGKMTVRAEYVSTSTVKVECPKSSVVVLPSHAPEVSVEIVQASNGQVYRAQISFISSIELRAMNGKNKCSNSTIPFKYIDSLPELEIGPEISVGLEPIFKKYCKINDSHNNRYLNLEKYNIFKYDYSKLFGLDLDLPATSGSEYTKYLESDETDEESEFFKFSISERGSLWLDFTGFLRVILYLVTTKKPKTHPIDVLVLLFQDEGNQILKSKPYVLGKDYGNVNPQVLNQISRRPYRSFDIYSGPSLVALLEEKPGWITTKDGRFPHKFNFVEYDNFVGGTIVNHIELSESFNNLLIRILQSGLDLAISHSDPNTRGTVGRCWHIQNSGREKIGVMWDYPGQFSTLAWHPKAREVENTEITLTLYDWTSGSSHIVDKNTPTFSIDFINFYNITLESDSVSSARSLIEKNGYKLVTRLYKLTI